MSYVHQARAHTLHYPSKWKQTDGCVTTLNIRIPMIISIRS